MAGKHLVAVQFSIVLIKGHCGREGNLGRHFADATELRIRLNGWRFTPAVQLRYNRGFVGADTLRIPDADRSPAGRVIKGE